MKTSNTPQGDSKAEGANKQDNPIRVGDVKRISIGPASDLLGIETYIAVLDVLSHSIVVLSTAPGDKKPFLMTPDEWNKL